MILELKITFFIPISMVVNIILHLKKFLYNFASLNREIFLKLEDYAISSLVAYVFQNRREP